MYLSRRTNPDDSDELTNIVAHARLSNSKKQITGILLTSREYFLQVMEGRVAILSHTLQRIFEDSRHTDVRLVLFHQVSQRLFAKWSMEELSVLSSALERSSGAYLVEHLITADSQSNKKVDRDDIEGLIFNFMGLTTNHRQLAEHI